MAETSVQRTYRAACPGCGAAVEFRSLASTHAVCGFCQSTIVRDGDALSRIGKMSEVFDDYSPLQLFSQGKFNSVGFTVVGRLQYKAATGSWSEWLCALDDGSTASLSEDNGSFVWSVAANTQRTLPKPEQWVLGNLTAINGRSYSVASIAEVALMSAQGELPKLPPMGTSFTVVELRSSQGEVISIDYSAQPPALASGVSVILENLQLTGLRDLTNATGQGGKEVKGRHFNCPNCGNAISVKLETSKSISCSACNSLIDLSQGIGGELAHAMQDEPVKPLIPLGSTGTLQGKSWQIIGFQHRMGREISNGVGDDSDDDGYDESFGWSEYLLYNAKAGFQFLVDSEDGWSLVKPTTGAPEAKTSRLVTYQGASYTQQYAYKAETNYVAGEFYWRVERGQVTHNEDYASGKLVLSREQSAGGQGHAGKEITWSIGSKLEASSVASAFKLQSRSAEFQRSASSSDVSPISGASFSVQTVFWVIVVLIFLFFEFRGCTQRDCDPQRENCSSARSSGGSYGGYSGSGGHK